MIVLDSAVYVGEIGFPFSLTRRGCQAQTLKNKNINKQHFSISKFIYLNKYYTH